MAPKNMKTFLVIWLGELISILGSGLTAFALGVWTFSQTGKATPFALVVLFNNLPRILLSPVAGTLADRWNRRRVMILADSGNALVTLAIAALLWAGRLDIWLIYVFVSLSSVCAAFQEPAYMASITMLVPKKDLGRASGLVQMTQALEMIISPVLAGVLFVMIGLKGVILIDFATYFFAIGALILVKIPQPKTEAAQGSGWGTVLRDAIFGWQYLRARKGLFGLLWYFALVNFLVNFGGVLAGPLVLSFASASTFGWVQMILGAGMLIGSLVMSAWGGPKRRIPAVIGFIALGGVGLFIAGLHPSALFVGAGLFLLTFFVPLASGTNQAVWQAKIAPGVQGRVFAMRVMISRSMMPLAFLSAGPLADQVFEPLMRSGGNLWGSLAAVLVGAGPGRGIGLMFSLAGLTLVAASVVIFMNPRIRRIEDELPDPVPDAEPAPELSHTPTKETAITP